MANNCDLSVCNKRKELQIIDLTDDSDSEPDVKKAKTSSPSHESNSCGDLKSPKGEDSTKGTCRLCLIVNSTEETKVYYQPHLSEAEFHAVSQLHAKNDFEDDHTGEVELDGFSYDARQMYQLVCQDTFDDLDKDDRKKLLKSDLYTRHSGLKGVMGTGVEASQWDMKGKRMDGLCIFTLMD
jgi:hypothetical protein